MLGASIANHQDLRAFAIATFPAASVGDVDAVSEEVIAALAAPAATHGGAVGVGVSTPDGVEEGGIPPPREGPAEGERGSGLHTTGPDGARD